MKIFSGSSNKPLAEKIAQALDIQLSPLEIFIFPDGERRIQIQENVVEEDCIVVQTTSTPVDTSYMELFFIIDGLKRSGAKSITVVVPYLGYQRQDHVFRDGEAVSLDVVVHALEGASATRVITCDLHSIKIPEVFNVPVAHLSALPLFAEKITELLGGKLPHISLDVRQTIENGPDIYASSGQHQLRNVPSEEIDGVLISPDMGGLRRISQISELLAGMPWLATVKDRDLDTGSIVINNFEGDMSKLKKTAFVVDDMIASGKTIVESAKLLHKHQVEEIYVFATHAVFSQEAPELLENSLVKKVFVTDSVFVSEEKKFSKLEILSISEMIAKEINNER